MSYEYEKTTVEKICWAVETIRPCKSLITHIILDLIRLVLPGAVRMLYVSDLERSLLSLVPTKGEHKIGAIVVQSLTWNKSVVMWHKRAMTWR